METINGTAVAGEDYKTFNKVIHFKKKEALQEVYVEIVDDCEWEPDEFFFVKLKLEEDGNCILGTSSICEVTIINDDGKICSFGNVVTYSKTRWIASGKYPPPPWGGFETYIILKHNILAIQNQPAIQNNPRFRGVVALGS